MRAIARIECLGGSDVSRAARNPTDRHLRRRAGGRKLRILRSKSVPIKKRSLAMLRLAASYRFGRWQFIQREAFRLCFRLSLL